MTIYNLVIPEERKDKQSGEVRTFWHRVGSAFPQKSGQGFALVIPVGVNLRARVDAGTRPKRARERI